MRNKKGKRSYIASCQTCDNNSDFQIPDDLSRDLESRFYNYFDFGYRQSFFNNSLGDSFEFLINKVNIVEKCIDVFFCSETGTYRSAHDFGDVSPSTNANREEVPDEEVPDEEVPRDFGHLWVQCEECYGMNYRKYFFQTRIYVCEFCDCHVKLPSSLRIELLIDTGTWLPLDDLNQDMDAKPDLDPWMWDPEDNSNELFKNTSTIYNQLFKNTSNNYGEKAYETKEKPERYEETNSNNLERDSNSFEKNPKNNPEGLSSNRGNNYYSIDTNNSGNNNSILDYGNQGMHKNIDFVRLDYIVENSNNKADGYNGPSIETDTEGGFHNPTASEDVGRIPGTGYPRDNLHGVPVGPEHLNACPRQDEDTSNDGCGRDGANSEGVDGHGSGDSSAHREGPGVETSQDSVGYDDLPDSSLCGEDILFDFLDQKLSEAASTVLSKENCGLHIHPSGLPIRPIRILAGSDMLRNRMSILLDPHSLLLGNPRGSGSPLKKNKGICDSDSDSESESESDHKSDDKEEKEFDSFLCIPFFIKNQELDLDSPCIPLIPTFISTKKTEKRTTDTRKGGDEWKKEWYSDEVKVASHHVNWWRQCKEEGTDDWYSDKVKNACQQLAEVDWWRHWNEEDWDNVKKILEDVEFVVEIEEEVEAKPYVTRTFSDQDQTGLSEAIQTGFGQLNGIPVALGVMEFEFIGGSMGHTVGERITRLIEYASRLELPLIIVCASGGARLYEGAFSLMQMAKISSALHYFEKNNKNPFYISMLASPTTGGVTASFGMLGDIIISEPDAYIAFAGKRVIEDTLKIEVPEGSQVAEVAFEKGLLDLIIPREMLKGVLSELLQLHNFLPLTPKIKGLLS